MKGGSNSREGACEFRMASLEMDIPLLRCTEEVGYLWRLVALVADNERDKNVRTVTFTAYFCRDNYRSHLWFVL